MKRNFFTSYARDSWNGEKIFDNAIVSLEIAENDEKLLPVLLQQKISDKINDRMNATGRFFPVTLINFWEID